VVGPAGVLAQNPEVNEAVAGFSQLGLVIALLFLGGEPEA
jgi:hypothetical protein